MKPANNVRMDRLAGRAVYRFHRFLYRVSGGRIGNQSKGRAILLLTTTGRRSGEPRTTPLMCMPHGDDYVVVGSNAGRDQSPLWLRNLEADPRVRVQVGRRRFAARARVAEEEERARLWPTLHDYYDGWSHYESLTSRHIPVVILTPTE